MRRFLSLRITVDQAQPGIPLQRYTATFAGSPRLSTVPVSFRQFPPLSAALGGRPPGSGPRSTTPSPDVPPRRWSRSAGRQRLGVAVAIDPAPTGADRGCVRP
jgi:hypothetical protein